jgi:hypothetical protein
VLLAWSWLAFAGAGCLSNPTPHPGQPDSGRLDDGPDVATGTPDDPDEYNGGGDGDGADVLTEVPTQSDNGDVVAGDVDPSGSIGDADPPGGDALAGDGGESAGDAADDDDNATTADPGGDYTGCPNDGSPPINTP